MPIIKLKSSDDQIFEIDTDAVKQCGLINVLMEQCEDVDESTIVPIADVRSEILCKVVEYCEHHKEDQESMEESEDEDEGCRTPSSIVSSWDSEFLKLDQATLLSLLVAANFMDIKSLFTTCCKVIANMIKAKTPEEIRKTFDIKNDFTPEEEEAIRKENKHVEEKY